MSEKDASATHFAYVTIRKLILLGDLAPEQKHRIDLLRDTIGTGASPIRKALSLLTSDMPVEREDQRGFRAAATSRANFEEILTCAARWKTWRCVPA